MTAQPQQPNPTQNSCYHDDEIELIDYLRVLWKWKWLIILVTLVCMFVAAVVSFMMPKIYKVSMSIEPGVIGITKDGIPIYLDSATNIKAKIEDGAYNSRILKELNIDPYKTGLKFKVANPKNTILITISSEWEQNQIAIGKKVFRQLLTELSHDYKKVIQAKEEDIDKQIMAKQNQLAKLELERKDIDKQILLGLKEIQKKKDRIRLQETILKNMKARESELIREVNQAKNNIERIEQQRDKILEAKSSEDNISLLFYFATVQQNVTCLNQLNNELHYLRTKQEKAEAERERLNNDVDDINTEIERLKAREIGKIQTEIDEINKKIEGLNRNKNFIEDIKLISEPKASISPIKPKKKLNVTLAGVVGFMLSVFIAFFAEYIRKYKEEGMIRI
jgi:capsular polysaccharide biosynthesis protein